MTGGYLFFGVDLFLVDLLEDLLSDHLERQRHVLAGLRRDLDVYQVELLRKDLGFFLRDLSTGLRGAHSAAMSDLLPTRMITRLLLALETVSSTNPLIASNDSRLVMSKVSSAPIALVSTSLTLESMTA